MPSLSLYGVDFTSAPRPAKPITIAAATLDGDWLTIEALFAAPNFAAFSSWLDTLKSPAVLGVDFPLGMPATLLDDLGWGKTWQALASHISSLSMAEFLAALKDFRERQAPGHKQLLRESDRRAKAQSPMMVYGVPVGRMFFRGVPLLWQAGVAVQPCHPKDDPRTVIEVYPALVARHLGQKQPYKSEGPSKNDSAARQERQSLLDRLEEQNYHGIRVRLAKTAAELALRDFRGDYLDAIFATLPTAWASRQRQWGIPSKADPREGWIVDPLTFSLP